MNTNTDELKPEQPLISIIIPVKNGESTIEKCINSILNLNYTNYEIVIINDGSTDDTENILNKLQITNYKLRIIKTDGVGPSTARNIGIKEAKGEYIALTDGDCIVDKNWLHELLSGFNIQHSTLNTQHIMGVGGDQQSPDDDTDFGKMLNKFMKTVGFVTGYIKPITNYQLPITKLIEVDHNPTCNVMYKKEVFDKVGYFLEGFWPGEDVELDYRIKKAGYKILFNPEAIVYHYRPDTIKKYFKMMDRYGQVQSQLIRMNGFFRKIHFVPIILFLVLVVFAMIIKLNFIFGLWIILISFLSLYFYFFIKTKIIFLSCNFVALFIITLISWNYGFIKGLFIKLPLRNKYSL